MNNQKIFFYISMLIVISGCSLFDDNSTVSCPLSYDLREEGLVTPVKSQCGFTLDGQPDIGSSVGVCWAFSTLASLESSMLKKGIVLTPESAEANLSPWYIGNYIGFNIPCYEFNAENIPGTEPPTAFGYYFPESGWGGGCSYWTADYLISGKELPLWCDCPMPFEDMSAHNDLIPPDVSSTKQYQIKDMIILLSMDFSNDEDYKESVKNYIRENGAIQGMIHLEPIDFESITSFECNGLTYYDHRFMDLDNFNMYTYELENLSTIPLTHAITIAGWDDLRSINVDGHLAEGAWLIKDSMGKDSYDNGYFWVAYDDLFVNTIASGLISCEPDLYQHQSKYQTHPGGLSLIKQGESFGENQILELGNYSYLLNGIENTDSWGVAKFDVQESEQLAAVGLFTVNRNQALTLQIHKNDENNEVVFSKEFNISEIGYHLLDLDSEIPFEAGETIVIAAGFIYNDESFRLPLVYVRDENHVQNFTTYYGIYSNGTYTLTPYSDLDENSTFFMQAVMR